MIPEQDISDPVGGFIMSLIDVQCVECGATIQKTPYHARKWKHHYCNQKCFGLWQSKNRKGERNHNYKSTVMQCAVCGREIHRSPSRVKRAQTFYCSHKCRSIGQVERLTGKSNPNYNRVSTQCGYCGASLMVIPFILKTQQRHFCSKTCLGKWRSENIVGENHPNWTGGDIVYYGPNWESQRRAARDRDQHRCQACGRSEKQLQKRLDVHHITPFRMFGYVYGENENYKVANELCNLISLCARCHQLVEHGIISVQTKLC
jgi:5-methylcytosine-specific restriction endonuclease McrA